MNIASKTNKLKTTVEPSSDFIPKTFCILPWIHLHANASGRGKVCWPGDEFLQNKSSDWQNSNGLLNYFNSDKYKKIRIEMLNGKRPKHCLACCFSLEDAGGKSERQKYNKKYSQHIPSLIEKTNTDGSINNPQILYIDLPLGNQCNLRCRMCGPWSSFSIAKDWEKMGKSFDAKEYKKPSENKWYVLPKSLGLIKETLPHLKEITFAGGEPMIIKEHMQILKMIIEEGHAHHIEILYTSNHTVLPQEFIKIWKHFNRVSFCCSVEAQGILNDYIRHPSIWKDLEKNIYTLDKLADQSSFLSVFISSTFQVYNISRVPELLDYLRYAKFKSIHRFPYFQWIRIPEWIAPNVLPMPFREKTADRILKKIDEHEKFFLTYNEQHIDRTTSCIQILRGLAKTLRTVPQSQENFDLFIKETRGL